ncbi:MAG: glycine betaine ABC transporter substrate-binding protein [Salinisphaera sp.]|jgi:glycine betaine/proline transport system substrate-binding protein|nr:glycine betaine ABC transporter substrate-binding protein [Salinisphaera sp.]
MKQGAMRWAVLLCVIVLAASVTDGCARRAPQKSQTITIGWTAWDDAEFVSRLAKALIEQRTDYHVKLKLAAIGQQYKSVANGSMDLMMMAWLPDTHKRYWKKVHGRVVDLGTLYRGGQLGWVVPDYVPIDQLASIADLRKPDVQARLGGQIQGIDPGAGLMQLSAETIDAYGLSQQYRLISGDGNRMVHALADAIAQHRWIVVTAWTPHWMFARYKLRYLADPKGTLVSPQHVDVIAREGFLDDYPKVAAMLGRMHIPLATLQSALSEVQKLGSKKAIQRFIDHHQPLINRWFSSSGSAESAAADSD